MAVREAKAHEFHRGVNMTKSIARKSARRACVALTAVLLAGCSLPAMLESEHSDVRGVVSFNGAASSNDYSAL